MYRLLLLVPLSHFWPFNIDLCYFQRWSLQWLTFAGRCVWHSVHCEPRKQTWQFACWPIPTWIVCVYSARLKYDLQSLYLALAMYDKRIQGVSKKRYFLGFLSFFSSRGRILLFRMCFGIRISSPFHLATQTRHF